MREVFTRNLSFCDKTFIVKELFDDEHQHWYTQLCSENRTVLFVVLGIQPDLTLRQMYSVYDQGWDAGFDHCNEMRGSY